MVIGEDRDFHLEAGSGRRHLQFDGLDGAFDYETFSIELNAVEQCKLKVNDAEEKDARGRAKRKRVRNELENIEGVLRVDVPINRGRLSEVYPQYPVLVTEAPSYVHWDDAAIEQGAHERERFRFVVEPFTLDSLDALGRQEFWCLMAPWNRAICCPRLTSSSASWTTSISASPPARRQGGYQVYGGAGTFDENLTLNGGGLQGGGKLDFRTAHAESDRFVLLPDSTKGIARTFTNREATKDRRCQRSKAKAWPCCSNPASPRFRLGPKTCPSGSSKAKVS